jgi:N-acetylmuramoyl-L-alanine amidase
MNSVTMTGSSLTMTGLLIYLLKVSLISGLLFAYYRLFLRDRMFHQYNRLFLLAATLLSVALPFIPLPSVYSLTGIVHAPTLAGALHAITPGDWHEAESPAHVAGSYSRWVGWQGIAGLGYVVVSCGFLFTFFRQIRYVHRLPGKYPREKIGDIHFYLTTEPGTPFSFLNRLFWNAEIDINSSQGRQVLEHELYHIRQRHTLDLLLLKIVMILFWPVVIFYLIYREIRTIHEFLADRHAVSGGDRYQYAELLVWHSIHDRPLSLLHPFFQSSIKRRITMITQFKSTGSGYISRLMVAPLVFVLLGAFANRLQLHSAARGAHAAHGAVLKPFTVVIDAGHGGIDAGAVSGSFNEKAINLALALKVKELGPDYHVNVVLTRQDDELAGGKQTIRESLEYRAALANENKADLFVSIHVNSSGGEPSSSSHGFSLFVSPDNSHSTQSMLLGSALIDALKESYATDGELRQLQRHIYVLRNTDMPAVLLECGFIDNPADLAFITNGQNQEKVAREILQGIQRYEEGQASK